jgi:cytochrome c oxidase subunit III
MGSMPHSVSPDILKGGGPPPVPGDFGDDGGGGRGASRRASLTGLMVVLAASTMLFAAFSSAYVVRRGLSDDWVSLPLPSLLWFNSAVLIASSVLLEVARRALRAGRRNEFNRVWTLGTALGAAFLVGQAYVWRQLSDAGIYVATNPSSSFFYVFTAAHAIHLLGGMSALVYVNVQAFRLRLGPGKRTAVEVSALFWHFLDALWIYLMVLFLFWG